ncbi:MAG TPA: nucleoside deaminase [Lentimicrobium sp.]|nr:nucleoside deaminase [Lentimicrobium sp.]
MSELNLESNIGGPFGAVVVKDGRIIARGSNQVTKLNDPTAHAEIVAIRDACRALKDFQLTGCDIYCSCEPCPMCFGAIYWARPSRVFFAATRHDAANAGFDDDFIYKEMDISFENRKIKTIKLMQKEAILVLEKWVRLDKKTPY